MSKTIREFYEAVVRLIRAERERRESEATSQNFLAAEENLATVLSHLSDDDLGKIATKLEKTSKPGDD